MLKYTKYELMVKIMMGNENVFKCHNTFCLIALSIIEISFVGVPYYFVRFYDKVKLQELI